ncbi:MAG: cupredoxin domain-containing protein [Gemmatimonadaceae bacterium]|nr:cupredoxin domain-containing protein [Gemmatimonadaceae bacterium]
MRFKGFALTGVVVMLAACGGGDKASTDTAAAAPAAEPATPAAEPAAAAPGAMAPITGTTHEVKMYGDAQGYRFEPADLTIKAGDGIKFVFVNGGPHNVAFDPATVPAAGKAQLDANMPEKMGELSGKMLLAEGESYTISFAGVAPGTYDFNCTPHLAMNMKGKVTVQ